MSKGQGELLTFGEHLEVLRRMLFRVISVVAVLAVLVFCFKEETFELLLAPTDSNFCLYNWIEQFAALVGHNFEFEDFNVRLISTELSAQFMTHMTSSLYLALLLASPYILYEMFAFVAPALYEDEKRKSSVVIVVVYLLFAMGVLLSYFILFPISFRFLATYEVASSVENTLTLTSYISTFTSLTLIMGVVFQLPVVSYLLASLGIISSELLGGYRRHAVMVIAIVSAIITPPDIMTCILVMGPLYLLYECSIWVVAYVERKQA